MKTATRIISGMLAAAFLVAGAGIARAGTEAAEPLNESHTKVHKSYGPLAPTAYDQALVPGSADCADLGDVIPFNIKFKKTVGSLFNFTVSWAEANTYINIYFLDSDDNVIAQANDGPPATPKRPKEVHLGSLDNGTYNLCVINSSGANAGITLDATVSFAKGYVPPPVSTTAPAPTRSPEPTPVPTETPKPTVAPTPALAGEPVATPGPDGPETKQGLLTVAGGKQAVTKSTRSIAQLVFLILTIVVAVVGIVIVAMRIRRDTT
jgi:hypothetical protein